MSREFGAYLAERDVLLPRPHAHWAQRLLKPIGHLIESVNATLTGQLDLERRGGH